MDEFAKMIYEQWNKDHDNRDLFFKKGTEFTDKMEEILSVNLLNDLYSTFCDSCQEVEENAFIEGFAYACKCLSRGKIEFGRTQDN